MTRSLSLCEIAELVWMHVPQRHFKSYRQFKIQFNHITEQLWQNQPIDRFKTKEAFAKAYWLTGLNQNR